MTTDRHDNDNLFEDPSLSSADEEKQIPLLGGVIGPESLPGADDLDAASLSSGRKFSQSTILIVLVVLIAGASLYLMRATQTNIASDKNAKSLEAKIEQALAKLSNPNAMAPTDPLLNKNMNVLFKDTDSIINMFAGDNASRQVPVEYLKKNPFAQASMHPVAETDPNAHANESDALLERQIQTELKTLRLETVMQGARPIAIINGNMVQPGQTLGRFTVSNITGMAVELQANGKTYQLVMETDDTTKNNPGSPSNSKKRR